MKACICKTNILFVFMILSKSVFLLCTDKIAVNFDRLFPQTSFEYVLESCMKLCEDISCISSSMQEDTVEQKRGCEQELQELELFSDALVGKLFHIKTSIENMRCQRPQVHSEDIVYLCKLFDKIFDCYVSKCIAFTCDQEPQVGYVAQLVGEIKRKLKHF